jgi:outer membrane protein assembly factor BamB
MSEMITDDPLHPLQFNSVRVTANGKCSCRRQMMRMSRLASLAWILLSFAHWILILDGTTCAENWPTYRHDNRRSGVTNEQFLFPLDPLWVWESPQRPRTAWSGPAKWDAYTGNRDLQSMRNFDPCYFVTADQEFVFFGSSSDDSAHALDAASGKEVWVNVTGAPVRLPPTIHGEHVLYGSDDGYVYCVNRRSGDRVWKTRGGDSDRKIFNDRKLISLWPVRTGVMIDNDLAIFGASLVPWEVSHLVSVDASTGKMEGPRSFRRDLQEVTLQGALLASEKRIYVPQGRSTPLAFQKANGESLGAVGEAGGVFCILTEDEMLLAGPNHQKETEHQIRVTGIGDSKAIASFAGTNRLVVAGKEAWFSIAGELRKLDREIYLDAVQRINQALASVPKDQKPSDEIQSIIEEAKSSQAAAWQWAIPCGVPLEMVKAGDALILGFAGEVRAYSSQSGELLWSQPMDGAAFGLAVAGGRLFVSTDEGDIHAFGRRQ